MPRPGGPGGRPPGGMHGPGRPGGPRGMHRGGPPPPPPPRHWRGGYHRGGCLPGCCVYLFGSIGLIALIVLGLIALF